MHETIYNLCLPLMISSENASKVKQQGEQYVEIFNYKIVIIII